MNNDNLISINAGDEANAARQEGRKRSSGQLKDNPLLPAEITQIEDAGRYECTLVNSDGSYGAVYPHVFSEQIFSVGSRIMLYFDKVSPLPKIMQGGSGSGGEVFVVTGNLPFAV